MILTISLALLGFVITLAVYHWQKNRAKLNINIDLNESEIDPKNPKYPNAVYVNNKASRAIDITIKVNNQNNVPVNVGPYVIGVPKIQFLQRISFFSKFWPNAINIPISKKDFEQRLMPREKPKEYYETGFEVARILREEGYSGKLYILFGLIDENKNNYYSEPFQIDIDEWEKSRGQWLMM